jgi:hypothetical protein
MLYPLSYEGRVGDSSPTDLGETGASVLPPGPGQSAGV